MTISSTRATRRSAMFLALLMFASGGLSLAQEQSFSDDRFVRPDGSDSACNGRVDAPASAAPDCAWRQVSRCASQLNPGQRCLIAPGEYEADFTISRDGSSSNLSGTVQCTRGSTSVTGVSTRFTTEVEPGDYIRCDAYPGVNEVDYRIQGYFAWTMVASVESDTALTLAEGYRGVTDTTEAGNDQVGRFITYQGTGSRPIDTRITHWKTLGELGITPKQYTGHSADCDASVGGTQDCSNIYYFDAQYRDLGAPDPSTGLRCGIMQGDYNANPLVPYNQVVGQSYGPEQFFDFGELRVNTCDSPHEHMRHVEVWPGSYWVDQGAGQGGSDRWYYRPRNADGRPGGGDDIYIGVSRRFRVNASYLIFRNLSTWAANHGTDATTDGQIDSGVVIGGGEDHIQFRDYWHFGNRWGGLARNSSNTHIVLEDARLLWGYIGFLGDYSGMYNVEVRRSVKSFNGDAGAGSEQAATVFDRVWHANSMAYHYDPECNGNEADRHYDWDAGTSDPDYAGTHGWYLNVNEPNPPGHAWVINSIVEATSDGINFPTLNGKIRFINNTFGENPPAHGWPQQAWPSHMRQATNSDTLIYNNAFLDYGYSDDNVVYHHDADYTNHHQSNHNAYLWLGSMTRRDVVRARGGLTITELRADGHEAQGMHLANQDLDAIFVKPRFLGGSDYTPVEGNPVINAGDNSRCPSYDFYGNPRNDGACDIGAVEFQSGSVPDGPPDVQNARREGDTKE